MTHVTSAYILWPKASYMLLATLFTPQTLPGQIQLCQRRLQGDCQMDWGQTGGECPSQINISTPWELPAKNGPFWKCREAVKGVGTMWAMTGRSLDTNGGAYTREYSYLLLILCRSQAQPFPSRVLFLSIRIIPGYKFMVSMFLSLCDPNNQGICLMTCPKYYLPP